jgi:hypothetical protein
MLSGDSYWIKYVYFYAQQYNNSYSKTEMILVNIT